MLYRDLFKIAEEVKERAYAPYSKFKVGAALLTKEGQVFTGVNVENASFGSTICAERAAVSRAITEGYQDFQAIAVASSAGEAFPCGICRQVIFEFGSEIKIITGKDSNHLDVYEIQELLPKGFRL